MLRADSGVSAMRENKSEKLKRDDFMSSCAYCSRDNMCQNENMCRERRIKCIFPYCHSYISEKEAIKMQNRKCVSRPLTKDTKFLVGLWADEGDSAFIIANTLGRPVWQIRKILRLIEAEGENDNA